MDADIPGQGLVNHNCLILALKEKKRDYSCLLSIKPHGILLPFKVALEKLRENGIPLDDIFVYKTSEKNYHVTAIEGIPIDDIEPKDDEMVGVAWAIPAAIGVGSALGSYLGNKGKKETTAEQVPLETKEQREARQALLEFARTGKYGDFTAGADIGVQSGDYSMTGLEQQGQSALERLLGSAIPGVPSQFDMGDQALAGFFDPANDPQRASQYAMGDDALATLLNTDPAYIQSQFDPFKTQVQRQIAESERALKRGAGFAGNLYSTNTIRGLGDIQARGNETLTAQLASLTNDALNRRLAAIPLAYQSGAASEGLTAANLNRRLSAVPLAYQSGAARADIDARNEGINQSRIASAYQYGGLPRALSNAATSESNAELIRRRNESLLPINTLQSVAGQSANFGVPSVTIPEQNPWLDLLNSIVQAGGQYYGSKNTGGGNISPNTNNYVTAAGPGYSGTESRTFY